MGGSRYSVRKKVRLRKGSGESCSLTPMSCSWSENMGILVSLLKLDRKGSKKKPRAASPVKPYNPAILASSRCTSCLSESNSSATAAE